MTKEQFDKMYVGEKLVIHCDTEEKANEFLKLADSFGYKWCDGESYLTENEYDSYGEDTCYYISHGFLCDLAFYKNIGYKVVKYDSAKHLLSSQQDSLDAITYALGTAINQFKGFTIGGIAFGEVPIIPFKIVFKEEGYPSYLIGLNEFDEELLHRDINGQDIKAVHSLKDLEVLRTFKKLEDLRTKIGRETLIWEREYFTKLRKAETDNIIKILEAYKIIGGRTIRRNDLGFVSVSIFTESNLDQTLKEVVLSVPEKQYGIKLDKVKNDEDYELSYVIKLYKEELENE